MPETRTKQTLDAAIALLEAVEASDNLERKANQVLSEILPHDDFAPDVRMMHSFVYSAVMRAIDTILEPSAVASGHATGSYYLEAKGMKDGGSIDGVPIRTIDNVRAYVYRLWEINQQQ